jgi:hypothetical protein
MPPLVLAASLVLVGVTAFTAIKRALTDPDVFTPEPDTAPSEAPVRTLRRDPATGEYRPV